MSKELLRATLDVIHPTKYGSAWRIAPGEDWDKLYEGIAANWDTIYDFLSSLDCVRDPHCTPFLADLEFEYGVLTNLSLTEDQRRNQLSPLVFNRDSSGSRDSLQNALNDAGFDVQVHENSPAVDPAIFLDQQFNMVADGGAAFAGNQDAFAGRVGGELLVNGDIFKTTKVYDVNAGNLYAGDGGTAGEYTDLLKEKVEYEIPTDESDWPFVFFVGGDATRDGSGALTAIESAEIPSEQESDFKRIILKYKPIHSWAGLIVTYT
jgi:hypothetical protein